MRSPSSTLPSKLAIWQSLSDLRWTAAEVAQSLGMTEDDAVCELDELVNGGNLLATNQFGQRLYCRVRPRTIEEWNEHVAHNMRRGLYPDEDYGVLLPAPITGETSAT